MQPEELIELRRAKWHVAENAARTFEDASAFVEATGFCLFYPQRPALLVPTFVGAFLGREDNLPNGLTARRAPKETADDAASEAAGDEAKGIMVRLLRQRIAFETKFGDENSLLVAANAFPFFYALVGDRNPKAVPATGPRAEYSRLAIDAFEVILRAGPISKDKLIAELGGAISEAGVDSALDELWSKLRITRVDYRDDEGIFWDAMHRWAPEAVAEGSAMSVGEALSALISRYLDGVVAAEPKELEEFFAQFASRAKIKEAVNLLLATREISFIPMGQRTVLGITPPKVEPPPRVPHPLRIRVPRPPRTEPQAPFFAPMARRPKFAARDSAAIEIDGEDEMVVKRPSGPRPSPRDARGARPMGTRPVGARAEARPGTRSGERPSGVRPGGARPAGARADKKWDGPRSSKPTGSRPPYAPRRTSGGDREREGTSDSRSERDNRSSSSRPTGDYPRRDRPAGERSQGARPVKKWDGPRPGKPTGPREGSRPAFPPSASRPRERDRAADADSPRGKRPTNSRPTGTRTGDARTADFLRSDSRSNEFRPSDKRPAKTWDGPRSPRPPQTFANKPKTRPSFGASKGSRSSSRSSERPTGRTGERPSGRPAERREDHPAKRSDTRTDSHQPAEASSPKGAYSKAPYKSKSAYKPKSGFAGKGSKPSSGGWAPASPGSKGGKGFMASKGVKSPGRGRPSGASKSSRVGPDSGPNSGPKNSSKNTEH